MKKQCPYKLCFVAFIMMFAVVRCVCGASTIWYSGTQDRTIWIAPVEFWQSFDVDGNGIVDFDFYCDGGQRLELSSRGTNAAISGPLDKGVFIGSALTEPLHWSYLNLLMLAYMVFEGPDGFPDTISYGGSWAYVTNKFVGLSFDINGSIHYGWARMSFKGGTRMILHDWAYERQPEEPIHAGELPSVANSFDGDQKSDLCLYYPPEGLWYFSLSSGGFLTKHFGFAGADPIIGDFDGDGKDDYGCYDAEGHYGQLPGSWYFMQSTGGFSTATFGYAGTVPVTGDFDGDGKDDYGCYDAEGHYGQPAGSWYLMQSKDGFRTEEFGYAGTVPVVGDFDGDGTDDYGCYDANGNASQPAGSWYLMQSKNGFATKTFGYAGTVPVVGDFDGDGIDDYGCYDAEGHLGQPPGSWYIMQSTAGFQTRTFGYAGTVPVVGDFDGDGTYDYGCYDADGKFGQSPGSWYIMQSTDGFRTETFGYVGTIPVGSTVTTP